MDATLVANEPWSDERATAIIAAHTAREGAALPILHDLQAAFGHIPNQAVLLIADALNLTRAEVHGIVTFYHNFRRHPPNFDTSSAPSTPTASTRNPFALVPSAKASVPIPSGGGIAATKLANAAGSSDQISTTISAPCPGATRSSPGLAGFVLGRA